MSEDRRIPIELTQGYIAYVDPIDADLALEKWYVTTSRQTRHYAARMAHLSREVLYLHRIVLSRVLERVMADDERVEFVDENTLNNSRSNLRLATRSDVQYRRPVTISNSSGYRGVSYHKRRQRWQAQITLDKKARHLGYFDTPEAAHEAYCKAAAELHGENARTE